MVLTGIIGLRHGRHRRRTLRIGRSGHFCVVFVGFFLGGCGWCPRWLITTDPGRKVITIWWWLWRLFDRRLRFRGNPRGRGEENTFNAFENTIPAIRGKKRNLRTIAEGSCPELNGRKKNYCRGRLNERDQADHKTRATTQAKQSKQDQRFSCNSQ